MKAYTDKDAPGTAPQAVLAALGVPRHIRQARLTIAGTAKTAAALLAEQLGLYRSARHLAVAESSQVEALAAAGLLDYPAVYFTQLDGSRKRVVKLTDRNSAELVGHLVIGEGPGQWTFEPVAVDPQTIPSAERS